MTNRIITRAQQVITEYHTNDPRIISDALGIVRVKMPLGNMRGFIRGHNGRFGMVINDALTLPQELLTTAHELGHYFLHDGQNRIFLDTRTYCNNAKYEREANIFAVHLVWPSVTDLYDLGDTVADVAAITGLSEKIINLRIHE